MKKVLIFVCCFVLCFSLMVVSVSASELDSWTVEMRDGSGTSSYNIGVFRMEVVFSGTVVATFDDINIYQGYWTYSFDVDLPNEVNPCSFTINGTGGEEVGYWMDCFGISASGDGLNFELRFTSMSSLPSDASPTDSVLGVFGELGTWISDSLSDFISLFWDSTDNTLTLIGTLSVAGLGVSLVFVIIGMIRRMITFT